MFRSFFGSFIFFSRFLFCAAFACGCAHAGTEDDIAPPFSFGGFGTLGLARTTGKDRLLRDISQPKGISHRWSARNDSVLGLQAGYRVNDRLGVALQGASFLRHDGSYHPRLTWAFLKYELTPRFSLRLGRAGSEFSMLSDSRRIGYSYLPARPRIDFYGTNPFAASDGINARLRWPVGNGVFRLEVFAGKSSESVPPYDLKGSRLLRGMLGYDSGDWQLRYIHARARLAGNILGTDTLRNTLVSLGATGAADDLALKNTVSRYHSLGFSYDDGLWQVLAAAKYVNYGAAVMENLRAVTWLIARKFGDFKPFIAYTWAKSSAKTINSGLSGPAFASINEAIAQTMVSSHLHRQTRTLGARWDFARNMDFKAQIDFVRGSKSSVLLLEDGVSRGSGKTKIFSLSLDFMF